MNLSILAKANQIIRASDAAYLGVIDENGYPLERILELFIIG